MNGKDLRWVQGLAEHVYGPELPTEHPVSVGGLGRPQETFIVTLWKRRVK